MAELPTSAKLAIFAKTWNAGSKLALEAALPRESRYRQRVAMVLVLMAEVELQREKARRAA